MGPINVYVYVTNFTILMGRRIFHIHLRAKQMIYFSGISEAFDRIHHFTCSRWLLKRTKPWREIELEYIAALK